MPAKPIFHRAPLAAARFAPLPLGSIRPKGWLRAQLDLQSSALHEALIARWPDLDDPSLWRAPAPGFWRRDIALLAAILPLGHLLEDEAWIAAADRRIAWAMETQREDGCIPPMGDEAGDWRARAALMQIFMQHYAVTADKGMLVCMLRYCKYAWERMQAQALSLEEAARAGELLLPTLWLYRVTGKRFLLELAHALQGQGMDWTAFCHTMPIKTPLEKEVPWRVLREDKDSNDKVADEAARRYHALLFEQAQSVSLAMGLKTPSLIAQWTGGIKHAEAFDVGYAKLMRYHGLATGIFSGDDFLGGASPARGIHNAALSELMTTLEVLLAAQGQATHGDLLEKLAYNALPAAYTVDMRAWQRVQQPNQVDLRPARRDWYNAAPEDAAFAPEDRDEASAGLHHGFPRFAASLWMASQDGGLAALAYAPCSVRARLGGAAARIDVKTAYPFDGEITMGVHVRQPTTFPLHLRIPDWAPDALMTVSGEPVSCRAGGFVTLAREWRAGDEIKLVLPMRVALSTWYHGSGALMRGPLLLAYAPAQKAAGEEVWAQPDWAYALLPAEGSNVRCDPAQAAPFGQGLPLTVDVKAARLPDWPVKAGGAGAPPIGPNIDRTKIVSLALVPYGGAKLRICQFPIA